MATTYELPPLKMITPMGQLAERESQLLASLKSEGELREALEAVKALLWKRAPEGKTLSELAREQNEIVSKAYELGKRSANPSKKDR